MRVGLKNDTFTLVLGKQIYYSEVQVQETYGASKQCNV